MSRRMCAGDNSNVGPAPISDELGADDVATEYGTLAMVVTVVLDRDHRVLPSHIEVIAGVAEIVENRNLRLWPREAGADEKQPQPGFPWRLGSGVV